MALTFKNVDELKQEGFIGFKKMADLFNDSSSIPKTRGVYMVLRTSTESPKFLKTGSGGHFKGKDPNVSISILNSNWVEDTIVVYIGKAGSEGSSATLHSRLNQYFKFGQGKNIGHYGGRLIWQLGDSKDLIVCWKALPKDDPRNVESGLIRDFVSIYSARPFANLAD